MAAVVGGGVGAAVLATGCATVPGAEDTYSHRRGVARAVPAVGAYLGQVLVRHLGGEWLPRKKLEEVQVRVGRRVWLPFLRVHRYVRSTQSLLDYSLTQLYREAERHRQ